MPWARKIGLGCAGAALIVMTAMMAWREPNWRKASVTTLGDLERELEMLREHLRIPGISAAIADAGRIVWARGFGLADVVRRTPAGPDTIYHLASVTKPFGATIVLQLVEEGRLSLDADVSEFGIDMARSAPVRVWHLLSHTSRDPPGAAYRYDGNAFGRLDAVVEQTSGRTFSRELTARIIHPLGLHHTAPNPRDPEVVLSRAWMWSFGIPPMTPKDLSRTRSTFADSGLDRQVIDRDLATGYARSRGRWLWPPGLYGALTPMPHGSALFTGGGLVASAPDVARFSIALDAGRLLNAESLARAYAPIVTHAGETLPYALGWFIQRHDGMKLVWHYGHYLESSSLLLKIPERRLTFVALANSDGLSRWRRLGDDADVLASPAAVLFLKWVANRHEP